MSENTIKIKIKSWTECPIDIYYKLKDIESDDAMPVYDKEVAIISLLAGVSEDDIWNLNIEDFKKLQSDTKWINNAIMNDVNKLKFKKITIDGTKYDVVTDMQKFTVGQYIDFQTFWSKRANGKMKSVIGNILACLIVPSGKKYGEDYDINELAVTIYNKFDVETAFEIISFFFTCWLRSIQNSLTYCKRMMKRKKDKKLSQQQMEETEKTLLDGFILLTQ